MREYATAILYRLASPHRATLTSLTSGGLRTNPANDQLNVEFVKDQAGDIRCQLVDMNGKMLMNQSYPHEGGLFSKSINVSNYATGIYFLRIQTAEGTTVEKVIVE